jgi:metal-responsive CopG/Arc/MetJ family transcriptional regulator
MIHVRMDLDDVKRLDECATRKYKGNRSRLIKNAIEHYMQSGCPEARF